MSNTNTTNADRNSKDNLIIIELAEEVKQQQLVTNYVYNPEIDSVSITLNHEYSEKKIISPIESTWPKTIDTLTKELQRKEISSEHITMICDVADNNAEKILKYRVDKQAEKEKEEENNKLGATSQRLLSIAEENARNYLLINIRNRTLAGVSLGTKTIYNLLKRHKLNVLARNSIYFSQITPFYFIHYTCINMLFKSYTALYRT